MTTAFMVDMMGGEFRGIRVWCSKRFVRDMNDCKEFCMRQRFVRIERCVQEDRTAHITTIYPRGDMSQSGHGYTGRLM